MAVRTPRWWTRWRSRPAPAVRTLQEGRLVYAIGDIHGRLDLLDQLLRYIEADRSQVAGRDVYLVFLGDYVDRGPDSCGVLDRLIALQQRDDLRVICLLGNHEELLLQFLDATDEGTVWLRNGGVRTLGSYDVPVPDDASVLALEDARKVFQSTFPQAHRQFLRGLKLSFRLDDYLFVHAGLKPGVPLEKQDPEHLIWIREPFLTYRKRFDQIVVHGHSVRTEVEFFPTSDAPVRIGVDTGAWKTGRLTALVLEGESRRLLQTGG